MSNWRRPVPAREDDLPGDDVLAHQAHVLARQGGLEQLDHARLGLVDVLDHHHRVEARRHRVARVHALVALVLDQPQRARLARPRRFRRPHRHAVHGRAVVVRRADARRHGLRGHRTSASSTRALWPPAGDDARQNAPAPPERMVFR
jgi:hypothetical protein